MKMLSEVHLTKIGIGACVLSLVFQILGISCPGWLIVTTDLSVVEVVSGSELVGLCCEVETNSAIWYVRVCLLGRTERECVTFTPQNAWRMGFKLTTVLTDLAYLNWTEVKIELTLALALCIAGLTALVICIVSKPLIVVRKILIGISSVCMLASGVLIIPAVIKVGLTVRDTRDKVTALSQVMDLIKIDTSWALILSVIGLCVAVIASFILAVATFKHDEARSVITPEHSQNTLNAVPFNTRFTIYPFVVANFSEKDKEGHIPPTLPNGTLNPPRIGSKDKEPLAFQNVSMSRKDSFDPYVKVPNLVDSNMSNREGINEEDEVFDNVEEITEGRIENDVNDLRMV